MYVCPVVGIINLVRDISLILFYACHIYIHVSYFKLRPHVSGHLLVNFESLTCNGNRNEPILLSVYVRLILIQFDTSLILSWFLSG